MDDGEHGLLLGAPDGASNTARNVVGGLSASALGGVAADLMVSNAATQWGWTAFLLVLATAGLVSSVWWLSGLDERSRGRRLAHRALIGAGFLALMAAVVFGFTSPDLANWAVAASFACIIGATLLVTNPADRVETLGGLAGIGVGAALIGLGVSGWIGGDTMLGIALIVGGVAGTGLGVAVWIGGDTLLGVAMIVGGVVLTGVGVVLWIGGDALLGVAMIGMGVAGIGMGVSMWIGGDTLLGVAMIVGGVAGIGLGVAVWIGLDTLLGVAMIVGGVAAIGLGVAVWIGGETLLAVATVGCGVAAIGIGVALWNAGETRLGVPMFGVGIAGLGAGGWSLKAQEWPGRFRAWATHIDDTGSSTSTPLEDD